MREILLKTESEQNKAGKQESKKVRETKKTSFWFLVSLLYCFHALKPLKTETPFRSP